VTLCCLGTATKALAAALYQHSELLRHRLLARSAPMPAVTSKEQAYGDVTWNTHTVVLVRVKSRQGQQENAKAMPLLSRQYRLFEDI
jgi:hypothetical protein